MTIAWSPKTGGLFTLSNTIGAKIQDSGASDGIQLLKTLQDMLPEFHGAQSTRCRCRREWLSEWANEVHRLIALKGLEQTADFLGMTEQTILNWERGR